MKYSFLAIYYENVQRRKVNFLDIGYNMYYDES